MPLPSDDIDLDKELLENQDPYDLRASIQVNKSLVKFPQNKAIMSMVKVP